LEVVLNQNVLDLKNQIETQLSLGAAAAMKLIHHGKILKDDQVLSSIGLKEGDFVVLMTTKKKRQVKKANAETASNQPTQPPAATTSSSSNQPSSSATSNNANPDPPASNSNAQPMSGASALVPVSQVSAAVQNLVNMGFPEAECRAALAAAFNNPDRAVEYLINGIPESARRQQQQAPPPSAAPLPGTRPMGSAPAPNSGAAQPQSGNVVQTIMHSLLQTPALLQALINSITNIRPQECQAIREGFTGDSPNPQQSLARFAALLNDSEVLQHMVSFLLNTIGQRGGPAGPGGVQRVQVNPQELEQIQRLAETTNLSQEEALRIFLRAGRNAELAASLVFEAQASGNLGAFGAAPNANANQPAPAPNANANANPVQANANANAESNMEVEENNDAPDNANNGGDPAPDSGANSGDTS